MGNGVVAAGAGTEDAGIRGSSICTVGAGCSSVGRSTVGWSYARSGGER